jgi:hypothetical protein
MLVWPGSGRTGTSLDVADHAGNPINNNERNNAPIRVGVAGFMTKSPQLFGLLRAFWPVFRCQTQRTGCASANAVFNSPDGMSLAPVPWGNSFLANGNSYRALKRLQLCF